MANCDSPAIIIDPGTLTLKAGFSGDDSPRFEFPNIIGRQKIKDLPGCTFRDHYIGDEAKSKRGLLRIKHPVEYGMVTNFDDMELILHHTINEQLRVDPKQQPVMFIEPALVPKCNREKITQIMFELFEVPCFCLQDSASLSLLSTGRTTGAVLESGDGSTHASVVYEGHTLKYTIPKSLIAGKDITYSLMSLFDKSGLAFSHGDFYDIRRVKENVCFISQGYQKDVDDAKTSDKFQKKYELPDGRVINVNEERFRCCECLFSAIDDPYDYSRGMHELVNFAIQRTDFELRQQAYSNIVISGGNTLFPGFAERLKTELDALLPHVSKVIAPPSRKYAPWIGASIMTSLQTMRENWITKEEYEEIGPDMVHRKYTIPKSLIAGKDITYSLMSLFDKSGLAFSHGDFYDIRRVKENVCFISQGYQKDVDDAKTSDKFQKKYELPDGRVINVNEERFRCCECLFSAIDDPYDYSRGMHELVNFAIQRTDFELRQQAYSNIVISGGNTLFPGFAERLKTELDALLPHVSKVIAPPSRKYAPWIGASIMTSLQTMRENWITKEEYEEIGPDMVHRKCF